jgi:hypothetical protein
MSISISEHLQPEQRSWLKENFKGRLETEVPSNTPFHIQQRLRAGVTALVEKRFRTDGTAAVSQAEERAYQAGAEYNATSAVDKRNRERLEELRQGGAFSVTGGEAPAATGPRKRYESGQTADPTQSLRDDDDYDPEDCTDADDHDRSCSYYRAVASRAKSMDACVDAHKSADRHAASARKLRGL